VTKALNYAACAALLCMPLQAYAQVLDFTPDASRILSDPTYLPLAGQIYGDTAYTHTWTNGSSSNAAGAETSSFHVNTNTIDQALGYGITDDLTIGASIEYDPSSWRDTTNANGATATLFSSGLTDPSFGLTWRALDQSVYPASLDFFGSYSPNWINADNASAKQSGTVASGGQSGTLGAAIGEETRSFSIRGAFSANLNGDLNKLDLSSGDTVQTSSYTDYVLSLETQTRLTDLFGINANVTHTFASNENGVNTATGLYHLTQPGDSTSLQLGLNYQVIPNAFVVAATYAYNISDSSNTTYANSSLDTVAHNKDANVLGMRLDYAMP
jgi:hypothetical protein